MKKERDIIRTSESDYKCDIFLGTIYGELAEWSMALPWKGSIRESVSWVRIPCSPPFFANNLSLLGFNLQKSIDNEEKF